MNVESNVRIVVVKMRIVVGLTLLLSLLLGTSACAETGRKSLDDSLREVSDAYRKVSGFEALIETRHETPTDDVTLTKSLSVSKDYGWKIIEGTGKYRREIWNDFSTSYVYSPEQKRVLRLKAQNAEVAAEFRKPVSEINPVFSLDRSTLKFHGEETFENQKVYHYEGTTMTQFLQGGSPVKIRVEAWISPEDGLPRKTVEYWADRTGTTIYRDVKLRDDFSTDSFHFVVPAGVEVIEIGSDAEITTSTK
jgi:outer membrane lipoprotein-sorting protein